MKSADQIEAPARNEPPSPVGPEDYGLPAERVVEQRPRQTKPDRPLLRSSAEFVAELSPPAYMVDGILQRGYFYSLTGHTGSGKTAITLFIVASIALARPVGKHEVEQGRVLYFAGENPDDIRMRWLGMAANMDFDVATVPVDFIPGTFKISEMAARIASEVQARGPVALVVIDTSAAFFEENDENNNAQQGVHARRLRSLVGLPGRPMVIANCHPPKNAGDDRLIPRGGGAFIAEVDGNLTAVKKDGTVELHWQGKIRGPDFAPVLFQLRTITSERVQDAKGRAIPTVMAAHLSEDAHSAIAAAARDDENRLLQAIAANPDASLSQLAVQLGWNMRNGDPHKVKVQRARAKLKEAHLIAVERGKHVVTERGKNLLKKLRA